MSRDEIAALFWNAHKRSGGDYAAAAEACFIAGRSEIPSVAEHTRKAAQKAFVKRNERWMTDTASPIIAAVAIHRGVDIDVLVSPDGGNRQAFQARHEVMWLLRQHEFSYRLIAIATNRKDHTSVMNGIERVEVRIAARPELRDELLALVGGAGERRLS